MKHSFHVINRIELATLSYYTSSPSIWKFSFFLKCIPPFSTSIPFLWIKISIEITIEGLDLTRKESRETPFLQRETPSRPPSSVDSRNLIKRREGDGRRRILTLVKKEHRRCEFFDAIDPRRYSNEASPFLPMKER